MRPTHGPWHLAHKTPGNRIVASAVGPAIATFDDSPQGYANGKLIAAAPDLLERCHEAKDVIGYALEFLDNGTPICSGSELEGTLRDVLEWLKTSIRAAGDEIA